MDIFFRGRGEEEVIAKCNSSGSTKLIQVEKLATLLRGVNDTRPRISPSIPFGWFFPEQVMLLFLSSFTPWVIDVATGVEKEGAGRTHPHG
ncbi:hypothetical protein OKA04_16345 [Luteolibacter flavescens]|uniref:Uncharacterized protein n=1 Tax=Luteolibacter flavescens TaxID=1859460 RepID=A0ABT3FSX3_9BACT|nr:hypothetical protein [Luteolibacter flavescens]